MAEYPTSSSSPLHPLPLDDQTRPVIQPSSCPKSPPLQSPWPSLEQQLVQLRHQLSQQRQRQQQQKMLQLLHQLNGSSKIVNTSVAGVSSFQRNPSTSTLPNITNQLQIRNNQLQQQQTEQFRVQDRVLILVRSQVHECLMVCWENTYEHDPYICTFRRGAHLFCFESYLGLTTNIMFTL